MVYMEEPLRLIYDALRVPPGLLASDEARKRSAAAQLLRRTPGLCKTLEIIESRGSAPMGEMWDQLDLNLKANSHVIDHVSEALGTGELDPILGGYPSHHHDRPWEGLEPLKTRIRGSFQVPPQWKGDWETLADLLETEEALPAGPDDRLAAWLGVVVDVLLICVTEYIGRAVGC